MLKKLFFKTCYFLGFYPKPIEPPKVFYDDIQGLPKAAYEYELREKTRILALVGDKKYYEALLAILIKDFKPTKNAKFIGVGYGFSSLNAYRKVKVNDKLYFEKIYFNSYKDLDKIQWFQNNLYKFIKEDIIVPQIEKIFKNDRFSLTYFEYFDLVPLKSNITQSIVELSKKLYKISRANQNDLDMLDIPDYIKKFEKHHRYKRCRQKAESILKNSNINIEDIEALVQKSQRIITHGDIQVTNIFQGCVLLDWDSFGLYPMGFEQAFIYFRLKENKSEEYAPLKWLEHYYKSSIENIDWKEFRLNFCYFLLVFSAKSFFKNSTFEAFTESLIKILKQANN